MTLDQQWLVEDRVIKVDVTGDVSGDDLIAFNEVMESAVASGTAPVHVVADATDLGDLNVGPQKVIEGNQYVRHENVGVIVLIGANAVINALIPAASAVLPIDLRHADSVDAALSILRAEDSTL